MRRCRGCSAGCRPRPAGWSAGPSLGHAGRVPGGRVWCGVRRVLRSVAERRWSALVRRGCLLCTCCTAGDRGGARCQMSRHWSATGPTGDPPAWGQSCGSRGESRPYRVAGVISGDRLHDGALVRRGGVRGTVRRAAFLRSPRGIGRRRRRSPILVRLSHGWPADETLRRCRSPRHDAQIAHMCEGERARGVAQ
jgi:hypothetical protein